MTRSSKIVRLPTAATSYYTVRRSGRWWCLELVTPQPAPLPPLRTKLRSYSDRDAAISDGIATGNRVLRPFKIGGRRHG